MITIIICATIVACVYIFFYFINKLDKREKETARYVNIIFEDMINIKEIVDRTKTLEAYDPAIKHNLLTISSILSKYYNEAN